MTQGLSPEEVTNSRLKHGSNTIELKEERVFIKLLVEVVSEPMFILLLGACLVYLIVGQFQESIIMFVSILLVAGISIFQDYRSRNAVQALKKIAAAKATVIRNGLKENIAAEEVVVNDLLLIQEGEILPADGMIETSNDFSINESILTGESFAVNKSNNNHSSVFKGTLVTTGKATIKVTAVGLKTKFGKIGLSLQEINVVKTPLQKQIRSFVKSMVWLGGIVFFLVVGINYYHSGNFTQSFLQGLTLAMSIIPEEIPVAFTTFQALGAFRLLSNQIIVKQPQYVETLGSATVICADKTGTLTQNRMKIEFLYDATQKKSFEVTSANELPENIIEYAMWSSEEHPFDPMEIAIHELYEKCTQNDLRKKYKQIHEYPLGGSPPLMTHIFSDENNHTIIAVKGAPEAILKQSTLTKELKTDYEQQSLLYAKQGLRVLGIGKANCIDNKWPETQEEFVYDFLGLIAFQDPPKTDIAHTIDSFRKAGIHVKMITGDYADTALAIAQQIHLSDSDKVLSGNEVMALSKQSLQEKVTNVTIFSRMFPEAKLKVIEALKDNGEIVAMTGDGVNDAPALKAAHIGIAMGRKGTEVAKNAASLILIDDNLSHMTEAVALGRKIYDNLKKAIQYIVSIHIPIILIVLMPLLLQWKFSNIFSPVHVIFLELIMGPTCSIIYENEPIEPGTMLRAPRKLSATFLTFNQLFISIVQGSMITIGCLGIGYYFMNKSFSENQIRTLIFTTLLFSNIFLTLTNRSFSHTVFTTIQYKNKLVGIIILITLFLIATLLYVPFLRDLFKLDLIKFNEIGYCLIVAFVFTFWVELFKLIKNKFKTKTVPQN